jgi:phosphopantothenoylcysteine decarboxylase/phosphopantothenate--cysteine ligase
MALDGKNVVLGVTGSIAAYKAADLASRMRQAGANVHVVLTDNAARFVTPLTLATISRNPVHLDPFDVSRWEPEHTALADNADLFVVAPATANAIAKFACGLADDLLSTLFLAARCPVLIAPAMNVFMYENPVVQENIARLKARGVVFSDPEHGMLACGYEGPGRLRSVESLMRDIEALATSRPPARTGGARGRDLEGLQVVVTAGPTREPLDPVRFLSNRSSGKMGYAIAEAAVRRGARVHLVSGPVSLPQPLGVRRALVETTREMHTETVRAAEEADVVVLAAAPADYAAAQIAPQKIKKSENALTIELQATPDIAADLGAHGGPVLVGFAAETQDAFENAMAKLRAKRLDLIVLNDVTLPGAGFEADTNVVSFLRPDGTHADLPLLPKTEVADRLLDEVVALLAARKTATPT